MLIVAYCWSKYIVKPTAVYDKVSWSASQNKALQQMLTSLENTKEGNSCKVHCLLTYKCELGLNLTSKSTCKTKVTFLIG